MRPRRNFSLLLPAFLGLASLTSARLLAEEARAGAAARYVVFEIDADGAVRPQMHRIVELSSAWRSLTPEEVASRLARPARDVEQVPCGCSPTEERRLRGRRRGAAVDTRRAPVSEPVRDARERRGHVGLLGLLLHAGEAVRAEGPSP